MYRRLAVFAVLTLAALQPGHSAKAADPSFSLSLKDHQFTPTELTLPANKRIRLVVKNLDATPAEFEGENFKAEKVIPGGQEATILIGPLKPGTYDFVDEFNEATAKGRLIVK